MREQIQNMWVELIGAFKGALVPAIFGLALGIYAAVCFLPLFMETFTFKSILGTLVGSFLAIVTSLFVFYIQQWFKDRRDKESLLNKKRKLIALVADQTRQYYLVSATLLHDTEQKEKIGGIGFPELIYDTSLLASMRPQVLELFGWDLTREIEVVVLKFEELNEIRRIGKNQLVGAMNQDRLDSKVEKERAFARMGEVLRGLKSRRHAFVGALRRAAEEHGILDRILGLIDVEEANSK